MWSVWGRVKGAGCRLHPTPYTLPPYALHPASYTLHPTPYTLHPTSYALHPTPYTCRGLKESRRGALTAAPPTTFSPGTLTPLVYIQV